MLRLCSDNLILVAAPEKSFGGAGVEGTLTWEQIRACRFILREEGSATGGGVFLEALEKRGGIDLEELDVVARIENPNTIKQCVREGGLGGGLPFPVGCAGRNKTRLAEGLCYGRPRSFQRFLFHQSQAAGFGSPLSCL